MLDSHITFAEPWYLALLGLLPLVWWIGARSLGGLGPVRRWVVLAMRTLVVLLVVAALAGIQWVRTSERLTVFYLVDRSLSVPDQQRDAALDYVAESIRQHRGLRDRAGVIVFGDEAAVELPPVGPEFDPAGLTATAGVETPVDPQRTNLAAAMKLARASLPADSAGRIVLISDGNETRGDARQEAQRAARDGVGIDVVPLRYPPRADVLVERLTIPGEVQREEPFDLRVVVSNLASDQPVRGRLVISQLTDSGQNTLSEEDVELQPGKQVFSVRQTIDAPDFYTYEARFIPEQPEVDAVWQNNRATAFTHVRGRGQVLLIEDHEHRGQFDYLVGRLKLQGFEVTVQPSSRLFGSLGELQPYDTVLLGNVPREQFDFEQIDMLARNTQQLGGGLVMLGGPNSFGAGGWTDTELEKAMPVDFRIKNAKIVPVGALCLVIDRSGSMAGEKLEWCKAAAIAAVKTMGERDFINVIAFDTFAQEMVPMTRVESKSAIARQIRRLAGGGGTNMEPGMVAGYRNLKDVTAAARHMIVLTDGQTTGSGYEKLASSMQTLGMTVTAVAVGAGADEGLLRRIASAGGGEFYRVNNARSLPRIFMREARRVARPLIYDKQPVVPYERYPLEILRGIEQPLPPIRGFVLTTRKSNPLVEVGLLSPKPAEEQNATVLAAWQYGLGRSVALTTDAGSRWTDAWMGKPLYDRFFGQMVRWSMRPSGGSGKFTVATELESGEARLVISALDKDDEFLNFLSMSATAVGPEMNALPIEMQQTAPGRYVGRFPTDQPGSYFLAINPGQGMSPLRMGLNVPYGDEFRRREPNVPLLAELAALKPTDGPPGQMAELHGGATEPGATEPGATEPGATGVSPVPGSAAAYNPFRHDLPPARSSQDAWPWLIFAAACLFFGDVFLRRVQVGFGWVAPLVAGARDRLLGRARVEQQPEALARLRSRKAELDQQFERSRTAARFEPSESASPSPNRPSARAAGSDDASKTTASPGRQPLGEVQRDKDAGSNREDEEPETYTQRLLKAKRKVWDE
jgi:uncharacterized membrane protein